MLNNTAYILDYFHLAKSGMVGGCERIFPIFAQLMLFFDVQKKNVQRSHGVTAGIIIHSKAPSQWVDSWNISSELMMAKQCTGIMCNGATNQRSRWTLIFCVYYPSYMLLTRNYPFQYNVNALHVFIVDFITLIMSGCLAKFIFLLWNYKSGIGYFEFDTKSMEKPPGCAS